jgi:glycosyltransferase involved in cell wall biosynthesis
MTLKNDIVTILLSTYNGEKYLEELINSLKAQTYPNIEIIARDDNSHDLSIKILEKQNIKIIRGENVGAKKSFEILLKYTLRNTSNNYFMFCDQDDVWSDNKITDSIKLMKTLEKKFGKQTPLLVHTDLQVVNEQLKQLHASFWKYENINPKRNSLNELLLQNTITGCTLLINRKLAELSLPIGKAAIMHDWWIALVASSFGKIGVLEKVTLKYRQHENNKIGAVKFTFFNGISKILLNNNILKKNFLQAKEFFDTYKNILALEKKQTVEHFVSIEKYRFLQKRIALVKNRFFKHGILRNIGLFLKI